MSARYFSYASENLIDAQPSATATLFGRSSSGSDTTQTLTLYDSSASYTSTLNGQVEVVTTASLDSLRWVTLSATAVGTVNVYSTDNATAAVGDVRVDTQPTASDTLYIGLDGGNGTTYTFQTTLATAADILIGSDTGETADNIASAINDSSTGPSTPVSGTDWHASTTANSYASATVTGTVVTLTDKLACQRSKAWALAESASNFALRDPIGGTNGTLCTSIDPGDTQYYNGDLNLDSEDLVTDTLPGLKTGATDAIVLGGKRPTLHVRCENVGSAIALKYEVSNDNTNWDDGQTSLTSADNNSLWYSIDENIEYIRLNITTNANATASALSCYVIS